MYKILGRKPEGKRPYGERISIAYLYPRETGSGVTLSGSVAVLCLW
jgi:hypothetical protein